MDRRCDESHVFLISDATATAPSTAPAAQPDAAAGSPRDALYRLNIALRDGDAPAIRSLFHTHDENAARLIEAMADYASALVALHRAAEAAYGHDGANAVTGDIAAQSAEGLRAISLAHVKIEQDHAAVTFPGATDPPITLIRIDGAWKLPLSQLLDGADKPTEQRRLKELLSQAALARKTADELTAGKYREGAAKAAEVWRTRLLEPSAATTQPATKP